MTAKVIKLSDNNVPFKRARVDGAGYAPSTPCKKLSHSELTAFESEKISELYVSYKDVVVKSLVAKGWTTAEAYEITHEAFTKLLGVDGHKALKYLKSYLYRIAHNLAVDRIRKKNRAQYVRSDSDESIEETQSGVSFAASAEHSAEMHETLVSISEALKELPENCQQAFHLCRVKGMSCEEVAEKMGVSQSMVRKHVLRAIRHCCDRVTI